MAEAPERLLLTTSLWGLAAAVVLAVLGVAFDPARTGLDLWHAHGIVVLFAFLWPMAVFVQLHFLRTLLGRTPAPARIRVLAALMSAGAAVAGAAAVAGTGTVLDWGYRAGLLLLLAAAGMLTGTMLRLLPRRSHSVVDVQRDPLTKGDDACFTQLRFAHFMLPLGVLGLVLAGPWWTPAPTAFLGAAGVAGFHLLLAGYVLLSLYGIAHLAVPRLSGIPAIAAGAIKGELHTTLLGLVGLVAGFLTAPYAPGVGRGLVGGLGFFVFVGAFTFMGVLGANIMKNKSRTQRVTPEFVYVPWTFAGIFWLLSGVLMGMLLPAAQAAGTRLPFAYSALRFLHIHSALDGGAMILLLGFLTRLLPREAGVAPPSFQALKLPFYGLNAALVLLAAGELAGDLHGWLFWLGSLLTGLALAAWFFVLAGHVKGRRHAA